MGNKKGFTLTEILATLAIIGIIIAIAIPSFNSLSEKFKEDYYNSLEDTILTSAKNYYKDHPEERPTGNLYSSAITLTGLKEKKYVDNAKVYNSNQDCTGYVVVVKENDVYKYVTCMKCNESLDTASVNAKYCNNKSLVTDSSGGELGKEIDGNQLNTIVNSSTGLKDTNNDIVETAPLYLPVAKNFSMTDIAAEFIKEELTHTPSISRCDNEGNCISTSTFEELSPVNISHISLEKPTTTSYVVSYKIENETKKDKNVEVKYIGILSGSDQITSELSETFSGYTFKKFEESDDGKEWSPVSCNNPCAITNFSKKQIRALYEKSRYNGLEFITATYDNPNLGYTVTIDSDGGKIVDNTASKKWNIAADEKTATILITENEKISEIPTDVTKEGYTFDGWTKEDGSTFDINTPIADDIVLKAKWGANTYTIKFNGNSSSASGSTNNVTCKYNQDCILTSNGFSRTGYKFIGWSTEAGGQKKYDNSAKVKNLTTENNGSVNLFAVWETRTYNVSCSATNGSCSSSSEDIEYGSSTTFTITADTGYTTEGAEVTGTGCKLSGSTLTVSNVENPVSCSVKLQSKTYTVTFDSNGGSGAPSSQTKIHGVALTLSTTQPTRGGYTFQGWNTKSDGTETNYASGASYTANSGVTLYAQWKANIYTISYNANGGSGAPASQSKTHDVDLTLSATKPTRDGYVFEGWNTESDGTGTSYVSGGSYTSNSYVTLYAQWKANTYIISYNANGGSGAPSQQTKIHGEALTLSTVKPTRSGYVFEGWNTESDGTGTSYVSGGSYTSNSYVTLYAQWSRLVNNIVVTVGGYPDYDGTWTKSTIYVNAFVKPENTSISEVWIDNTEVTDYEFGSSMDPHYSNHNGVDYKNNGYYRYFKTFASTSTINKNVEIKIIASNGKKYIYYQTIKIDNETPSLTVSLNNGNYTSGTWTNSDVTRYIQGDDGSGSGILKYEYVIGAGCTGTPRDEHSSWIGNNNWTTSTTNYVCHRVVDNVGNYSEWVESDIKIDKTGPTCTWYGPSNSSSVKSTNVYAKNGDTRYYKLVCADDNKINTNVSVTAGANAVATYSEYSSSNTTTTVTKVYEVTVGTGNGVWALGVTNATDSAGNSYSPSNEDERWAMQIQIDNTVPTVPVLQYKLNDSSGKTYTNNTWTNQSVYRQIKSNDSNSGLERFVYTTNTSLCGKVASSTDSYSSEQVYSSNVFQDSYNVDLSGNTYYRIPTIFNSESKVDSGCFAAIDKAGNRSKWTVTQTIKIDIDKPYAPARAAISDDIVGLCGEENQRYYSFTFSHNSAYKNVCFTPTSFWEYILSPPLVTSTASCRITFHASANTNSLIDSGCSAITVMDRGTITSGITKVGIKKFTATSTESQWTDYSISSIAEAALYTPKTCARAGFSSCYWISYVDGAGNRSHGTEILTSFD